MVPAVLIARKRDGESLSDAEIAWLVGPFTAGLLPDYQMAALAMAIYFRGMSDQETAALTVAMLSSGTSLPRIAGRRYRRHIVRLPTVLAVGRGFRRRGHSLRRVPPGAGQIRPGLDHPPGRRHHERRTARRSVG